MAAATVLDASALLALLQGEPGAEEVRRALNQPCAICAVNVAEVLSKGAERGVDPDRALGDLSGLTGRLEIVRLEPEDLVAIAELRVRTRAAGLSLGDRACLALARRLAVPALTADRSWDEIGVAGIEVRQIR